MRVVIATCGPTFAGMTRQPSDLPASITATLAPCAAARRALAMPALPAPMTTYWNRCASAIAWKVRRMGRAQASAFDLICRKSKRYRQQTAQTLRPGYLNVNIEIYPKSGQPGRPSGAAAINEPRSLLFVL
jgi:hypothetical protein